MYRILVVLALFGVLAADEPCTCDQVTNDIEDLRKFLANPEKYSLDNILPGELSPYVCNCNKYRQRRSEIVHSQDIAKIHHEVVVQTVPLSNAPPPAQTPIPFFNSKPKTKGCSKRKQEVGRYRCASGYTRKGMFCLKDPCYKI